MANDGVIVVSDQTIGYTERLVHIQWDITPDSMTEREITLLKPYYSLNSTRNVAFVRIQYIYVTRWVAVSYTPIPISERSVFVHYSSRTMSERYVYYYPDTRERLAFFEGLFTNTPLLLKYPKYLNWNYVPQVLVPEFIIWSYYPLDLDNIVIKLVGSSGTILTLNSGVHQDKFVIARANGTPIRPPAPEGPPTLPNDPFADDVNKLAIDPSVSTDKQYKVTVYVDHTFENDEVVNCYLTAYDVKGQALLPGLW
jgi:hypothetical protein